MAILSINGLYDQYTYADQSVFSGLTVPTGMDKNVVIKEILFQCSELELLYPNEEIMKDMISAWSAKELPIWQRLYDAVTADYNPLWNVDASITETGNTVDSRSGSNSGSATEDTENIHSVKGYNSTEWSNSEKDVVDVGSTSTGTWSDESEREDERTIRRTGNIGVTSSQDLIKQEWEVAQLDVVKYIAESFKNRFCLLVY